MQFSVPQFVEVEDRIIGRLTIKQFLMLVFCALVIFMYWSIFKTSIFFFLLALPTLGFFVLLTFKKINGLPLLSIFPQVARYYFTPRYRIFLRTGEQINKPEQIEHIEEPKAQEVGEQKRKKLKDLAYILDRKSAEEDRLINSGKMQDRWLNQI